MTPRTTRHGVHHARSPDELASRPLRRLLASFLVVAAIGVPATAGAAHLASAHPVAPSQELAVLLTGHQAHNRPDAAGKVVATVAQLRPITGERTELPVIGAFRGHGGIRWLRVLLPGRPNGASGWIAQQGTHPAVTPWHLIVRLAARRVTVYRGGRLIRTLSAVVGKPSTPTPSGDFFVEETLQMSAGEPGGPFALALSARSAALQEFEGGPGQIALHGRAHLGGKLGRAESHGCVRLGSSSIRWLAERIGPGVPVTIYRR